MRYVRIDNYYGTNTVCEIGNFPINPNGVLFHPSLIWVQSDTAQIGMKYDPATGIFT